MLAARPPPVARGVNRGRAGAPGDRPAFRAGAGAAWDARRGYREEVRTVAEFRAARLCGEATWHTPGDAPRATSDGMTATDVRPVPPARDAVTLGYDEASRLSLIHI